MIYLGIAPTGHRNIFMCLPNNSVFTSAHAEFDENLFPKYQNKTRQRQALTKPNIPSLPTGPLGAAEDNDLITYQPPIPLPARQNNQNDNIIGDNQKVCTPVHSQNQLPLTQDEDTVPQKEENLPQPKCNPP